MPQRNVSSRNGRIKERSNQHVRSHVLLWLEGGHCTGGTAADRCVRRNRNMNTNGTETLRPRKVAATTMTRISNIRLVQLSSYTSTAVLRKIKFRRDFDESDNLVGGKKELSEILKCPTPLTSSTLVHEECGLRTGYRDRLP